MTFKFDSQLFSQLLFIFICCGIIYIVPKLVCTCIIKCIDFYVSRNPNIRYTIEQQNDAYVKHYDFNVGYLNIHFYKKHDMI